MPASFSSTLFSQKHQQHDHHDRQDHRIRERALSDLLLHLRESRGWDLDDLAARCGVHKKSLRRYERGKVMPTIANLARVADAYGFAASDLLDEINL